MVRNRGFSLLELITSLAVVSVLLMLGTPSFSETLRQNCVVSGANAMLSALVLARDTAVTRNCTVGICKSGDGLRCTRGSASSWTQGFITFTDPNHNGVLDAGEELLGVNNTFTSCATLSSNSYPNYVSFNGEGIANGNGSFFVIANHAPNIYRTVSIARGRARVCNRQTDRSCPTP